AGHKVQVPFSPGRGDASQKQADVESFAVLEPVADGFRNYLKEGLTRSSEELLVERARMLRLTAPEMTVLVGGMRALNANVGQSQLGVFTSRPETLSNDFFRQLLGVRLEWKESAVKGVYEGTDVGSGKIKCTATRADLIFGSNSQLRAIAEVYGSDDAEEKFVN